MVFKESKSSIGSIDGCSGGVRDALHAWPMRKYSQYDETGKIIANTLCIPPNMCGPLHRNDGYECKVQVTTRNTEEVDVTEKLLQEAKEAVPSIFADVGDMVEYHLDPQGEYIELEYLGRHETSPALIKRKNSKLCRGYEKVDAPQLGWLVFRTTSGFGFNCNGGIRDSMSAWPEDIYSPYDARGKRMIESTICLPPEKCGVFREYKQDWDGDY